MRRLGLIRPRDLVPSPSRRRAARCWPSAGLRGGQLGVSSQVPWTACGRLPLRGNRGPGPVRASVLLSRVLVEAGVTPAVHLHGPAPLATPHHHPYSARLARNVVHHQATEVAVRAWLDVQSRWGPPCSDDPASSSAVTGALVAGRAVTHRRREKRHSRDIPQLCP